MKYLIIEKGLEFPYLHWNVPVLSSQYGSYIKTGSCGNVVLPSIPSPSNQQTDLSASDSENLTGASNQGAVPSAVLSTSNQQVVPRSSDQQVVPVHSTGSNILERIKVVLEHSLELNRLISLRLFKLTQDSNVIVLTKKIGAFQI